MSDDLATIERADTELVDDSAQFFAPTDSDVIDSLLGRYQAELVKVEKVGHVLNSAEYAGAVGYFLSGASDYMRQHSSMNVAGLFDVDNAIFAMNSRYWSEALALTDVYDCMPQARRDYWNAQLQGKTRLDTSSHSFEAEAIPKLPNFEESTVRNTLNELLRQRSTFFAERVDGIFRGLSGHHVTNAPEAFGKRMIIEYMLSYGMIRHEKAGLINDLRCVIAKFTGRGEPKYNSSDVLVAELYRTTGQWVTVDGGTLRIRVYKKGTAHLEVHPDIAWRLNMVLSSLYPLAIPAEFRAKPKKKTKDFLMMGRPLPFATIEILATAVRTRTGTAPERMISFHHAAKEQKAAYLDACKVLEALGGTPNDANGYDFDYPVRSVLAEVVLTGCLPDQKAHQFYPTPAGLAQRVVDLADIGPDDTCLEPSAGQGGLADLMPKDRTTCVEISPLHCAVLRAKGFTVEEGDFVTYADHAYPNQQKFDVVVMNPPFSEGRAKLHLEYATTMVKDGGRLVAVLPAGMAKTHLPGFDVECHGPYANEFPGVSVSVVILVAVRT